MKSAHQLAEEARAVLNDDEHVVWHALQQQKTWLNEQAWAEPSPSALPGYYYRIRSLDEIKGALQVLANQVPSERKQLEAMSG